MFDFSAVPQEVMDEELPLECGRCTFRFWRRLAELAQLQRDTLAAECPRCQVEIQLDENELSEAVRQLQGIHSLRLQMAQRP